MSGPLAQSEAIARLEEANATIATCAQLVGMQRPTLERFLKEASDMDSLGPSVFRNPERRLVHVALIYRAALTFLAAYETHTAGGRLATSAS